MATTKISNAKKSIKTKPIKSWKPNTQTRKNTVGNLRGTRRGKNLIKGSDGFLYNQYGVEFSLEDKRALESKVNSANAKRRRMLKQEKDLQLFTGGEGQGVSVANDFMGRESDFVIQAKTKSLQRFKTREDYENYMRNLDRVTKRSYISDRVNIYKENYIKALQLEGFDPRIIEAIEKMKYQDFMKLSQSEEYARFGHVYDAGQRQAVEQGLISGIKRITGKGLDDFDGGYMDGDIDL